MSGRSSNGADLTVGVDLDNTVVSYDGLLHRTALEWGLINEEVGSSKREVRDAIRRLPEGDIRWQKLQGLVYGPKMVDAELISGVLDFFQLCRERKIPLYIISHKTEYAPYDETKTNLRQAALAWMNSNGLLEHRSTSLTEQAVCFESTRRNKIERIAQLGCTHFIDDLEETFLEESFPDNVKKILYSPHPQDLALEGATVLTSWRAINSYFFGSDG